jgi:sulfur carrier protein
MDIIVNGNRTEITSDCSLLQLLKTLTLPDRYAVEVNEEIIPRSEYSQYLLKVGDKIEIVEAIGGG